MNFEMFKLFREIQKLDWITNCMSKVKIFVINVYFDRFLSSKYNIKNSALIFMQVICRKQWEGG